MSDIVLQNVDRCAPATSSEVRRRPEHAFPIASRQVRSLLSEHSARYDPERVHQMRNRNLRRILNEQVDVMILGIHLDKFCLEVRANVGEQPSKSLDSISIEYSMPTLCDEDQVYVHCEDTSVCRGKRLDVLPWSRAEGARLQIRSPAEWRTTSQPATLCRFVPLRL